MCWLTILAIVAILSGGIPVEARDHLVSPQAPCSPPQAPDSLPSVAFNAALAADLNLPPLKAVLVVGPIDGDDGPRTTEEKANMELAAAELEANGVAVSRFYAPDADWTQVLAAADGAHFFFYRGHGVYWTPYPSPEVGGFLLSSGFVSSDQIRSQLHLAPNAIVMLFGCFTAGSSTGDADYGQISSQEAQRRVAQYSDPFFDVGAAGYFANWYGEAYQIFVRYLFQGMTLGEAYESFHDFEPSTVERYTHPDHPGLAMWLDKDYLWDAWQYDNAFAGLPDETLTGLFGQSEMIVDPSQIVYVAEPEAPPRAFSLDIDSTTPVTFTWTLTQSGPTASWLGIAPAVGQSGTGATIVITPAGQALGIHQAALQITAGSPDVRNGEQTISVTLHLVPHVHPVYLPLVGVSAAHQ